MTTVVDFRCFLGSTEGLDVEEVCEMMPQLKRLLPVPRLIFWRSADNDSLSRASRCWVFGAATCPLGPEATTFFFFVAFIFLVLVGSLLPFALETQTVLEGWKPIGGLTGLTEGLADWARTLT